MLENIVVLTTGARNLSEWSLHVSLPPVRLLTQSGFLQSLCIIIGKVVVLLC